MTRTSTIFQRQGSCLVKTRNGFFLQAGADGELKITRLQIQVLAPEIPRREAHLRSPPLDVKIRAPRFQVIAFVCRSEREGEGERERECLLSVQFGGVHVQICDCFALSRSVDSRSRLGLLF